jgi:hypothetical protein
MLWTMLVMMACSTQVTNPSAVDDDYAKLARRLPEFAGMYISHGELVVAVVGSPDSATVRDAVLPYVRDQGLDDLPLRVTTAKYTYECLRVQKDRLLETLQIEELTLAAIDEVANRIRLGVATEKARSRLSKQLMEIGLPADMVFVEVLPPYQRLSR